MASVLSMESPPFRPRTAGSGGSLFQSPGSSQHRRTRSGASSPLSHGSAAGGDSNAVPSYKFQTPDGETLEIRNVWEENVEEEMAKIRELIETHPYVAMDTEFPGVVARPVSETYSPDFHYKSLKCNFNLHDDLFAQDSIDLLVTSGISFEDHAVRGIDPLHFGELLMVSGLVLDDRVKWVSFHSGYDYAYLLKVLTTQDLPKDEKIYFPTIYDIKYMTSLLDGHFGGLQRLADDLGCPRIGPEHQAGSDSLLTMVTYFALANAKFTRGGKIDDKKYKNELYGYGGNHTVRKGPMRDSNSNSALANMNGNGDSSSVSHCRCRQRKCWCNGVNL
ncbi:hypothetical protein ACHAXT_008137 [Thalassiosira profunda]